MPAPKDPIKYEEWRHNISKGLTGKHLSDEAKLKIKMWWDTHTHPPKGVPRTKEIIKILSESNKGERNPNFGKHWSEEKRTQMSLSHMGLQSGPNSPRWKGGISFEPYCEKFNEEFKERVRAFFGYRCQYPGCNHRLG